MKYTLAIAHRVCPALAKTASHFTGKFEMVKATTASLANAIAGIRTKLVVILDGCPDEYARLFDATFSKMPGVDYERIATPGIGNFATYARQMDILCGADAKYLYFSEDDYIYKKEAFLAMMDFLEQPEVDFVTPLDHPDFYQPDLERTSSGRIRISNFCHWREIGSTCCTFMLKSETYRRAEKSLGYYAEGGSDYIMGMLLTKKGVYSPKTVFGGIGKYLFAHKRNWMLLIPALAWARLGLRLVLAPRFRLWSPIPSLAVHLCKPSLPPLWKEIIKGKD